MVAWDRVGHDHVLRAIKEYDRLGPERSSRSMGSRRRRLMSSPGKTAATRPKPSWAWLMNSQQESVSLRATSKAANQAPSECLESWDSRPSRYDGRPKLSGAIVLPGSPRWRRRLRGPRAAVALGPYAFLMLEAPIPSRTLTPRSPCFPPCEDVETRLWPTFFGTDCARGNKTIRKSVVSIDTIRMKSIHLGRCKCSPALGSY